MNLQEWYETEFKPVWDIQLSLLRFEVQYLGLDWKNAWDRISQIESKEDGNKYLADKGLIKEFNKYKGEK